MAKKLGGTGKVILIGLTAGLFGYASAQAQPNFNNISQNKNNISLQDSISAHTIDTGALAKKVSSLVDIVKSKGNTVSGTINGENVNYKEYGLGNYILQNFDDYFIIIKLGPKGFAYIDINKDGVPDAHAKNVPIGSMSSWDYTQDLINILYPSDSSYAIQHPGKIKTSGSEMNTDYAAALLEVERALETK